jgi:hypothetical protein
MALIPYDAANGEDIQDGTKDLNPVDGAYDPASPDPFVFAGFDYADIRDWIQYVRGIISSAVIEPVASLLFDTTAGTPAHAEGLMFYDNTNKALAYFNDEADVTLQVGQEMWIRVYNDTGSTITNGSVCYLSGIFSGFPTIALADASDATKCLATLGFATHDVETASYGYITVFGTVRGLDTSGCSAGDLLWLSATTAGEFTNVQPSSPNYSIGLGNCGVVSATVGAVEARVSVGNNTRDVINVFNGSILEDHTTTVTSNGTTITLSLEQTGGGDLSLFFDGGFTVFDSTPAATVSLTAGTDTVPVRNFVYIPKSTGVLTANTTGFPWTDEIVPIADVICQSAASLQTDNALKFHAWTDHVQGANGQGHITHVNRWIRSQNATWLSGAALTPTGGVNTFDVAVTAGNMLQLHEHVTDAFDTSTGSDVYMVNDNTTPYKKVGDLTQEVSDSAGVSMSGKYYSLVVWLVGSEGSGADKLYVNLPGGSYNSSATAIDDLSGYTNYSIPAEYKGTGMLLARITVRNQSGAGGTFTIEETEDLRGLVPSTAAGGGGTGGGGAENFTDLLDVPSSYSGASLHAVRVNTGETALEFYTPTAGGANTEQSVAYAASITPDLSSGNVVKVGALTGNITINNPSNATTAEEVYIRFVQDGTGGRTVTLGSDYVLLDSNANYPTGPNEQFYFSGITQTDGTIEGGYSPVSVANNVAQEIITAVSDETTALTTGTAKVTFRMPNAMTLTDVRASVTTAPTGSVLTADINEGGTSVLSTKLTIDAGEKTSTTAATPAVISDSALADDAEITIDIDGVGSSVAGAGLKVTLIGTRA